MSIPPVIKTVVRNGRTLVYRVQDASMDQEISSSPHVQSASASAIPASKKSKGLVRRVTGDTGSSSMSYPSMISHQLEHEREVAECMYIFAFSLIFSHSYYCSER